MVLWRVLSLLTLGQWHLYLSSLNSRVCQLWRVFDSDSDHLVLQIAKINVDCFHVTFKAIHPVA